MDSQYRVFSSSIAVAALAVQLLSSGCGADSPTDPGGGISVPPATPSTTVAGNVYAEQENHCAPDAVVEVLDGPKAGLRVRQDHETCVAEGNGWFSYRIDGLPAATAVTLRASAPGYASQERVVSPSAYLETFVLRKH